MINFPRVRIEMFGPDATPEQDIQTANTLLRLAEGNEEAQMGQNAESSMLHGEKAQKSLEMYQSVKSKYAAKLRQMGGVDAVLQDLEKYIVKVKLKDAD